MKYAKSLKLALFALFLAACSPEEVLVEQVEAEIPVMKVSVFDLLRDQADLAFTKHGILASDQVVNVMPEVTGRATEVHVKIGDYVQKGTPLVTLGDSLSTDMVNLQYNSAAEQREFAQQSGFVSGLNSIQGVDSAKIAVDTAFAAYQNALDSKDSAEEAFLNQLDIAELQEDIAKDAYRAARDADLSDAQVDQARSQREVAELAIESLEDGFDAQIDQLNFAITAAFNQYQLALNQFHSARNGVHLQAIGNNSQFAQADAAFDSASASKDKLIVRAPIDGKVSALTVQEGNFVAPGQLLMTITNGDDLVVKTALNSEEIALVRVGDPVDIEGIKGEIEAISSIPNPVSHKFDIVVKVNDLITGTFDSFVEVDFYSRARGHIFVPLNSVFLKDSAKFVRIVKDSKIQERKIALGQVVGDFVEITSGLSGQERVVSTSTYFLSEGDEVKVVRPIKR